MRITKRRKIEGLDNCIVCHYDEKGPKAIIETAINDFRTDQQNHETLSKSITRSNTEERKKKSQNEKIRSNQDIRVHQRARKKEVWFL